jgi:hypothetical protein
MAEPLWDYLKLRERELKQQISALRSQLAPREAELTEILRIKSAKESAVQTATSTAESANGTMEADATPQSVVTIDDVAEGAYTVAQAIQRTQRAFAEAGERHPFLKFEHFTIKQLVVKAMLEYFPNGATALELCEFVENAYGRHVERSSLSPQLSRLHQEGVLEWVQEKSLYRLSPTEEAQQRMIESKG